MKMSLLSLVTLLLAGAGLASAQSGTADSAAARIWPVADFLLAAAPAPAPPANGPPDTPADVRPCRPAAEACSSCDNYWARAEYLLWWLKDGGAPPLVTTGPAGSVGILSQPGTSVLFGGSDINPAERHGGRFTAGAWLGDDNCIGVEGSYFFLATASKGFSAFATAAPDGRVLARPFFNVSSGLEDSELVSSPGLLGGTVQVASSSRLQGAELHLLSASSEDCEGGIGLFAGFRYLDLDEGLIIREDLLAAPLLGVPGSRFSIQDSFSTGNDFYGGQLGVRGEWGFGRLSLDGVLKVALGLSHEGVDIHGATRILTPGSAPVVQPGGLLALPTNIGHYQLDEFAVVPEVGFRVRYALTRFIQVVGGYTFLYDSDVARPGAQIDRTINPTQLPTSLGSTLLGPARPIAVVKNTDFWAQGLSLGLEFRY